MKKLLSMNNRCHQIQDIQMKSDEFTLPYAFASMKALNLA